MNKKRAILAMLIAFLAMWRYSDGQAQQPVRDQMRLAGVMPRGALVYVQARDLSGLMKAWLASGGRNKFYKSKSYAAFTKSRIYLKLQDRLNDFEKAVGFALSEERLAEIAGGLSAISIYDVGKLEIALVTEVSREKAIATSLFKLAPQFEERSTDGANYFVREMTSDGGRLHQQFCFAHLSGRLIVTTTEGLMIRALRNAKAAGDDSLLADVMAIADAARGFTPHEMTMWLDQAALNRNLYFNNYWIHRNVKELSSIEAGLIDLRITPQGMTEQRWFKTGGSNQQSGGSALDGNQVAALMKFAPISAQLVEVRTGGGDRLGASVAETFFGKLPDESTQIYAGGYSGNNGTDDGDDNDGGPRAERYSRLDARFDMDVDDEQAIRAGNQSPASRQKRSAEDEERFKRAVGAVLDKVSPAAHSELVRSKSDASSPFVRFDRAVVIEMKSEAGADRAALERAIVDEMRARFVIAGIEPRLAWQEEASVRFLAQSLLEQGAAYSISGRYLVLASNREFVRDILQASTAPSAPPQIDGSLESFALVRVTDAKPIFDKLMMKLDGRTEAAAATDGEEASDDVKFFSENLSSLISASSIREMRVRREKSGSMIIERVVYSW